MGSGEGALSGDSYYGDGIYRSSDGGVTWTHVSTLFTGQAVSEHRGRPDQPAATCTPRPCAAAAATTAPPRPRTRRTACTSRPTAARTGRCARAPTNELHGATDLVMDPQDAHAPVRVVLGRRRSTSRPTAAPPGPPPWATCRRATSSRAAPASRSASRTRRATRTPTLYTGFDYFDTGDAYHTARVFKTHRRRRPLDARPATGDRHRLGRRATAARSASTTTRCKPDPTNPNVVYVAGLLRLQQQPAVRRHLPLDRRRRDLEEPRLRPAPGLPRLRVPARRHLAHRHRQRRRRVAVAPTAAAATAPARPWPAADWQNLNGTGRPRHRRADPLDRPGHHPVHLDRRPCRRSRASTGAAPRTTARCASRSPTTAGSTRRAVTAAR